MRALLAPIQTLGCGKWVRQIILKFSPFLLQHFRQLFLRFKSSFFLAFLQNIPWTIKIIKCAHTKVFPSRNSIHVDCNKSRPRWTPGHVVYELLRPLLPESRYLLFEFVLLETFFLLRRKSETIIQTKLNLIFEWRKPIILRKLLPSLSCAFPPAKNANKISSPFCTWTVLFRLKVNIFEQGKKGWKLGKFSQYSNVPGFIGTLALLIIINFHTSSIQSRSSFNYANLLKSFESFFRKGSEKTIKIIFFVDFAQGRFSLKNFIFASPLIEMGPVRKWGETIKIKCFNIANW